MSADAMFAILLRTALSTGAAALLVMVLRKPLLMRFGAGVAYAAWMLPPVALVAVLLPAPAVPVAKMAAVATRVGAAQAVAPLAQAAGFPWKTLVLCAWAGGMLALLSMFCAQQRRFRRALRLGDARDGVQIAQGVAGLPAVMGLLCPRIVLPADFALRYDAIERELILCHERVHLRRFDLQANALAAALRCVFWFDPLLHVAARLFRRDQELACDARVVASHPQHKRAYADAMLKTQMVETLSPVVCCWRDSNELKERIAMLKLHSSNPARAVLGAILLASLFAASGYAAWAAQPAKAIAAKGTTNYRVRFEIAMGGAERKFEIVEAEGKPFSFVVTGDKGAVLSGEGIATPWERKPGYIKLAFTLKRNGEKDESPIIVVKPDAEGSVKLATADGSAAVELKVTAAPEREVPAVAPKVVAQPPHAADSRGAYVDIASKNANPPKYPVEAARNRIGGKVVLLIDVAADGRVGNVAVEKSEPKGVFDAAVVDAAKKWEFSPAVEDGRAVAGRVRVPVWFKPGGDGAKG